MNLRSLDALRGLLATYVLIGHCRWLLWGGYEEWLRSDASSWQHVLAYLSGGFGFGYEAVMVFFVLSGCFIHLRVAKRLAAGNSVTLDTWDYARRRVHRLAVPYAFALVVTMGADALGRNLYPSLYLAQTTDALLNHNFLRKDYSIEAVLPAILFLPGSLGKDFGTNGPLWSIAYELIYYLLYPLWIVLRRLNVGVAYGVGVAVSVIAHSFLEPGFLRGVLVHWPIWLGGAAIAECFVRSGVLSPSRLIWLATVGVAATLAGLYLFDDPYLAPAYLLLGLALVICGGLLPVKLCAHSIHRALESLGLRSYTIYICHFPLVALLGAWTLGMFGARPLHGWLALTGVAAVLLVCYLLYWLCERHFVHARLTLD